MEYLNGDFTQSKEKGRGAEPSHAKNIPFLDMTNLYNKADGAGECAEMLINQPKAHALFEAQIAFRRGAIEKVVLFVFASAFRPLCGAGRRYVAGAMCDLARRYFPLKRSEKDYV